MLRLLLELMQRDYENLYLVDFVCHGVPSQKIFKEYLIERFGNNKKYSYINFRDKRNSYYFPKLIIKDENNKEVLNESFIDSLYLRGFENGRKVNDKRIISCVSRCLNVHSDYEQVMACAENPDLRFITCNTTEAGITYDPSCKFTETPPSSYPAKLTQFLYRRYQTFGQEAGKGFVILACELIDDNGKERTARSEIFR